MKEKGNSAYLSRQGCLTPLNYIHAGGALPGETGIRLERRWALAGVLNRAVWAKSFRAHAAIVLRINTFIMSKRKISRFECWWQLPLLFSAFFEKGWAWTISDPSGRTCTWVYTDLFTRIIPMIMISTPTEIFFHSLWAFPLISCKLTVFSCDGHTWKRVFIQCWQFISILTYNQAVQCFCTHFFSLIFKGIWISLRRISMNLAHWAGLV